MARGTHSHSIEIEGGNCLKQSLHTSRCFRKCLTSPWILFCSACSSFDEDSSPLTQFFLQFEKKGLSSWGDKLLTFSLTPMRVLLSSFCTLPVDSLPSKSSSTATYFFVVLSERHVWTFMSKKGSRGLILFERRSKNETHQRLSDEDVLEHCSIPGGKELPSRSNCVFITDETWSHVMQLLPNRFSF